MSEKPAEIIQTLREADDQSKATIEAARKERDSRLKQAASEADAEIAQYRASREADYQAKLNKFVGSTGETSERIAADAKETIERTVESSKSNQASVVDMLVNFVKDVHTDV